MFVDTIVVGALQVNCYVLGCENTREAIVVDPGDNAPAILAALQRRGLRLVRILATHAHFDHIMAARPLQEATGAGFCLNAADKPALDEMREIALGWLGTDPGEPPVVSGDLKAGEQVTFGQDSLEIRSTPGHSPGGVTLVDHKGRRAFTGDALFAGSIGRSDLPGGDIRQLLAGIRSQILSLPDDYRVLSGHGPATTVGRERTSNPFLDPTQFDYWS